MRKLVRSGLLLAAVGLSLASGGGGAGDRTGFIHMRNRAPDEWFQAMARGGPKLGCTMNDLTQKGQRILTADCRQQGMIATMIDGEDGTTAAMCDPTDKKSKVTDAQCADFMDHMMAVGRAP